MADPARRPIEELEARIGHNFRDRSLLIRALTHRSAVPGDKASQESYQRQEFLGDRVLGLVISEMLYADHPLADEGELARRFNQLVRRETCAAAARSLDIGAAIRLGVGERQSGGRRKEAILGDVMEALIAALYLDAGLEAARALILRVWQPLLADEVAPLRDPKTTLQEWVQGRGLPTPTYEQISRSGPDHAPVFLVRVRIEGRAPGEGSGRSKREAEQAAAVAVLSAEGLWSS